MQKASTNQRASPRPQGTQTPSSSKPALPPNLSAPVPPFHFQRGKEPVSAQECGWIRRRSRPQLSPDRSRRPRPPNRRRHRLGCLLVGAAASTGTTLRAPPSMLGDSDRETDTVELGHLGSTNCNIISHHIGLPSTLSPASLPHLPSVATRYRYTVTVARSLRMAAETRTNS